MVKLKKLVAFMIVILSASRVNAQQINCDLINIRYQEGLGCSENAPIKTIICFDVHKNNPENLKIEIRYPNNIIYTSNIKEYDKNGYVYYSFCTKMNVQNQFNVILYDNQGKKSPEFHINATATTQNTSISIK